MTPVYRGLLACGLALALVLCTGIWLGVESGRILALQAQEHALDERLGTLRTLQDRQDEIEQTYRGALRGHLGPDKAQEAFNTARQGWTTALAEARQAFAADTAGSLPLETLAQHANSYFAGIEQALNQFRANGTITTLDDSARNTATDYEHLDAYLWQENRVLTVIQDRQAHMLAYISAATVVALLLLIAAVAYTLHASTQRLSALKKRLAQEAMHNPITSLPNQRYLRDWLKAQISSAARMGDSFHVMLLDLEGFDRIQERHGPSAERAILQAAAQRLLTTLRAGDFISHTARGKFFMVFSCAPDSREVGRFAARLIRRLERPLVDKLPADLLSASIGVATYPADGDTVEALLDAAEQAMRQARQAGTACYAYRNESPVSGATQTWEISRF